MRTIWLFRSNILELEYYHKYRDLETFENNCHDFYLLMVIWFLRNDYFDEAIIWRLSKKKLDDIIFDVNGKKFIQRWVTDFKEVYKYKQPIISFWRGGFREYAETIRTKPKFFGKRLYLGAGRRIYPQYGDRYDIILLEDERDFRGSNQLPFYKTANPNIFKPLGETKKYDLCWPCNFSQIRHKGQEFFISCVSKSNFLRQLKIVHAGNKTNVGKELCKKYNVNNIIFVGWIERPELNKLLNQSKFGIVTSNLVDGCPRISTEILMSGTPLLVRDQTRILRYYKYTGVVEFTDGNIEKKIISAFSNSEKLSLEVIKVITTRLSIETICRKNLVMWNI
jgi:hypothetical protein